MRGSLFPPAAGGERRLLVFGVSPFLPYLFAAVLTRIAFRQQIPPSQVKHNQASSTLGKRDTVVHIEGRGRSNPTYLTRLVVYAGGEAERESQRGREKGRREQTRTDTAVDRHGGRWVHSSGVCGSRYYVRPYRTIHGGIEQTGRCLLRVREMSASSLARSSHRDPRVSTERSTPRLRKWAPPLHSVRRGRCYLGANWLRQGNG